MRTLQTRPGLPAGKCRAERSDPGRRSLASADRAPEQAYRFCVNSGYDACNWLVPAEGPDAFCRACRLNRTIPDLGPPEHLLRWQRLEIAKHRLVYGLLRLGLPVVSKWENPVSGLAFDFLADPGEGFQATAQITTGHARGLITINIAEADDAVRERARKDMAEPYRTLPGHFRHEIGHYYWERLVRDGLWLASFRELFGDERQDYGARLEAHHALGAPPDWQQRFVSSYASAHPWEDFAETWAHYLHMVDTLETADAFGLRVSPKAGRDPALAMKIEFDPYRQGNFDALIQAWLPLTYAVNSLNQGMGQPDLYPFVLAPTVIGKLRFAHGLIHQTPPEARGRQLLCRRRRTWGLPGPPGHAAAHRQARRSPPAEGLVTGGRFTAMPARRPCACEGNARSAPSIALSGLGSAMPTACSKSCCWIRVGRSFHCRSTAAPRHRRIRSSPSERGRGWWRAGSSDIDPTAPPSLSHSARSLANGLLELAARLFGVLAFIHGIWDA